MLKIKLYSFMDEEVIEESYIDVTQITYLKPCVYADYEKEETGFTPKVEININGCVFYIEYKDMAKVVEEIHKKPDFDAMKEAFDLIDRTRQFLNY